MPAQSDELQMDTLTHDGPSLQLEQIKNRNIWATQAWFSLSLKHVTYRAGALSGCRD